jgi:hypothetical protein
MSTENFIDDRLMKYITEKKYNRENETSYDNLEDKYEITQLDIDKIKRYLRYIINRKNIYNNHSPHIAYKNRLHYDKINDGIDDMTHNPKFDDVIKYVKENTMPPAFLATSIAHKRHNCVYNDCIVKVRDQYINDKPIDVDIMNDVMLGMPSHTRKSYGINDSFEHSFDYIDNDIQDPDHVVLPFPRGGESARLDNKTQRIRNVL